MVKFTCIATCFNDEETILDYFKEMLLQTWQPDEYILVDGGSKDNTVSIVESFASNNKLPIRVISGKRLNIAQGYNEGIKASNNDVLIITGIGNRFDVHFFEQLINYYEKEHKSIVYGLTIGLKTTLFSKSYNKLFVGGSKGIHPLPTNRGMLIEKSVFDKVGYFYEKLYYASEDVEFYDVVIKNNVSIGYTSDAVLYWETPKTFKEYLKQTKVYFIGALQLYGLSKRRMIKSIALLLFILSYFVFFAFMLKTIWPYIVLALLYILISIKIKSFSPLSVFLKCFDLLHYPFYYCKYHKFGKTEYRVHR